ncbi:DUF1217 domain-containing protein [Rhizobium sp. TRM95796]|uniref:DUF1217 domain-containing protein n=2 Tax=unclassified Rhizobium TaxID=2613769 RepID=UPI0021E76094|nr:DUF1217 domain-containing protein [Rhizobium sp. TRM95796]MCV3766343.1 DUF1217 domain-containing protein [Rhizobium sp. TRM95796]
MRQSEGAREGLSMVSTFLTYETVNRNYKASLDRVKNDAATAREAQYYQENIGKVKTVDEFVDDYRLYSYAMKAYGLEDMTYATAFMKKVLDSDLTDDNSFANKLADQKYRDFAAAFKFSTTDTAIVQTSTQIDGVIGAYQDEIDKTNEETASANAYYKATISTVKTVDDLLDNSRLRDYALKAYGVDSPYWSKDFLTKVLTSDVDDPASFVNQLTTPDRRNYQAMARAYNFNAAGALDGGDAAQTTDQTAETMFAYTSTVPGRTTPALAALNKDYYEAKIGTITSVDELVNDSRMFDYVRNAYGLQDVTLRSTLKNILTSDLSDPANYATTMGGAKYEKVAAAFNFNTDGTIKGTGGAQTTTQRAETSAGYLVGYDDRQQQTDDDLYSYYRRTISTVESIDDLEGTAKLYNFVLAAFGFDGATRKKDIEKALTSELSDPASFAAANKDKRFEALAGAFNFDEDGNMDAPSLAQSQANLQQVAKDYVVRKTRFGNEDEKEKATEEASYYTKTMQSITSRDQFLKDSRLTGIMLESFGLDPKDVSADFLKQVMTSDLSDPDSFANQQADHRFAEMASMYNFTEEGGIAPKEPGVQDEHGRLTTEYLYLQESLEDETGAGSVGAQLALYFQRMFPSVNTAFDILGDKALLEVFRTAYQLPAEMSSMDIDKQSALVEKYMDFEELQDPEELQKFITRFAAMYDLQNDTGSDPLVSLFSRSASSISADTLLSIAQLKNS